jgi:propanol-preferring alcohol dehydrogenase
VLKRITDRGSIVGTRQDQAFAAESKLKAHFHAVRLDGINQIFASLQAGRVVGRMAAII